MFASWLDRNDIRKVSVALAGFLLPWQTVWILRTGMLGGVPWPLATIGLYASDVVLLVVAVIGAVRGWRGIHVTSGISNLKFQIRRWGWGIAMLGVLAAMNTWLSADAWLSAVGWIRLIAFLFALAGLPYSRETMRAFLGGFLAAMGVQAIIGIAQFVTQVIPASTLFGIATHDAITLGDSVVETGGERWLRAYGGFPHPNVFGAALLAALVAFVAAGHGGPPLRVRGGEGELRVVRNPSQPPLILRGRALNVAFCIFTFALVLSFSRSAILGLLILLAVCAWRVATRRLALIGTLALIAAMAVTWSLWAPRVTGDGRNESRSIAERQSGIRDALALSAIHPFFGVGLHAMPQAVFRSGSTFNPGFSPYDVQPVHNVPLLILVEIGVVGVLVLVLVLVTILRHSSFVIHHSSFFLPLLPPLLLDHSFWSLPIGLALAFVLIMSALLDSVRSSE